MWVLTMLLKRFRRRLRTFLCNILNTSDSDSWGWPNTEKGGKNMMRSVWYIFSIKKKAVNGEAQSSKSLLIEIGYPNSFTVVIFLSCFNLMKYQWVWECLFFLHFRLYQTSRRSCPRSQLHWAWMSNLKLKLRICNVLPSFQNRGQWWKNPAQSCTANLWKKSSFVMKESLTTFLLHSQSSLSTLCSIVSLACMHTERMRITWRCSASIFIIIDGFGPCKMKGRLL